LDNWMFRHITAREDRGALKMFLRHVSVSLPHAMDLPARMW
jgi:hypothetical protein